MNRHAFAALLLIASEAAAWGGEATSRKHNAAASAVLFGLGDRTGQVLYRWSVEVSFRFTPEGALLAIEGRTLPVERRRNSVVPVDALFEVQDRAALTEITQRSLRP
jgi:hypothetical protein